MRLLGLLAGIAAAASSACGSPSHAGYVLVTVDARPAVHDAASITVTLANAGTMRTDTLMLAGKSFPVTFSISSPGRTGDLAITVDASDASGLVVGHGSAMTTVTAPAADVLLDSTDFVVNTDYAGDQFPTDDPQSSGFQLAAQPDGTWTAVFRDSCMQNACNVFARRFAATGKPAATQAAAGTNAFVVTTRPSDLFAEPAVSANRTATIALWNFDDIAPATTTGVACRSITAAGALGADQNTISSDSLALAVAASPLSTGDFAASWNAIPAMSTDMTIVVRAAIVHPDCSLSGMVQTVSTGTTLMDRSAVAASADHALVTWVSGGDLHARMVSSAGALTTGDLTLVPQTATDAVAHARIVGVSGGGFALAVLWTAKGSSTAPTKIELYQVTAAGKLSDAPPVLVTDQAGNESFGIASRPDDTVMVAWHTCDASGDLCSVSGRILRATGAPITDPFTIPTSAGGSQKRPSVVALPDAFAVVWSDSSGKPPDTAGQAVRARIIYPPGS